MKYPVMVISEFSSIIRPQKNEVIMVKTGISLVSIEQARLNLKTEMSRFGGISMQ
ncbi:hypothetical protein ES703_69766 [subsurface metagenome]